MFRRGDFAVARYNTDGSFDTTFGTGGTFTLQIGTGSTWSTAIAVQSDGKIVLAGDVRSSPTDTKACAFRLNSNGTLDTTFNGTGLQALSFSGNSASFSGVTIQGDGKIVLVGDTNTLAAPNTFISALARLNTDGTLDTSFGGTGWVTNASGASYSELSAVVIDGNGKLVVSGKFGTAFNALHFGLARYNSDGSIDTTFGSGGVDARPAGQSWKSGALADGQAGAHQWWKDRRGRLGERQRADRRRHRRRPVQY